MGKWATDYSYKQHKRYKKGVCGAYVMKDTAITCYVDNDRNIINEFGWLYKSWLYSGSWLVSDIVAFYNPTIDPLSLPQDKGVILIPLVPYSDKYPKWNNYKFINSVGFMAEPEVGLLAEYKYVMRTDCDCFLTPYFRDLRPRLTTFGAGQYTQVPSVTVRLMGVAERWNISPIFTNVGSTLIGYSNKVMMYSLVHLEYCNRLRNEEFTDEDFGRNDLGEWPGWYAGVLTMYAGQLAAQAYFGQAMNIGGLDVHCMCHDDISPNDYHIHAWHSWEDFSKLKWRKGEYAEQDMDALHITKISDYCLWIAGRGPAV